MTPSTPAAWKSRWLNCELDAIHPMRLIGAFLGLLCGAGLYLALVNRVLSHLRDGFLKSSVLPLALVACVGGLATYGYLAGLSTLSLVLAVILGWIATAEVRYRRLHRRLCSNPPLSIRGRQFSLWRPVTSQDLQTIHYQVSLPNWSGAGVRIAHLSDFHLHAGSSLSFFQAVVEQANAGKPDLVFITGDFVSDLEGIDVLPVILSALASRLGKFAVLGNHDYWTEPAQVREAVCRAGFDLLSSGQSRIVQDGPAKLALYGCAAPWSKESCGLEEKPDGVPLLVLSHTADHAFGFSQAGATAVFSGHYHAGQMQLPFFGPLIVPSLYGRLLHHGHFKIHETHLFVSAGVGASHPPFRIYCPPDILFVDLLGSGSTEQPLDQLVQGEPA